MMPVPNAQAQGAGAYSVSYVEVTQAAEGRAVALLKELSAASRAGAGNLRFDAVDQDHQGVRAATTAPADSNARPNSALHANTVSISSAAPMPTASSFVNDSK